MSYSPTRDHNQSNVVPLVDLGQLKRGRVQPQGPLQQEEQVLVHVVGARPNFVKMAPIITRSWGSATRSAR